MTLATPPPPSAPAPPTVAHRRPRDGSARHPVVLDFAGEVHVVEPDDGPFAFGRGGDLAMDTNVHLAERAGRIHHHRGAWWLQGLAPRVLLRLADLDSRSAAVIDAGSAVALSFDHFTIGLRAGRCSYEIEGRLVGGSPAPAPAELASAPPPPPIALTDEQRRLLVHLAADALLRATLDPCIESTAEVARRLGWTITKVNRTLDRLCGRLTAAGVSGLHGSTSERATRRRQALVEHAVIEGLVTRADLCLLGPR